MKLTSHEPFWYIKNGILGSYPSLRQNEHCDILIVGAGITGALMAHALVKEGYDVILVDKRHVATGSTSATTSMLQYEIDVPLHELIDKIGKKDAELSYHACNDAIIKLGEIVGEISSDCGFGHKRSLYIAEKESHLDDLQKEYQARKEAGFNVSWVSDVYLNHQYGISSPGGILSEHGGSVDAYKLTNDLIAWNIKKGLRVFDHTHIITTENNDNGSVCTTNAGYKITARNVVFCTGYETQKLLPEKIVWLLSTYACISEQKIPVNPHLHDTLVWNTGYPYSYLRTTDDGRLLIGGEDQPFKNPALRDSLIPYKQVRLEEKLKKIIPDVPFIVDFCWAGTFGVTHDGLPYIGKHPTYKNCYFVLGFGGNGITFSVSAMDIISDLLREKQNKMAEIFKFGR